jgi:CheY-like chemotaxis protein
MIKILVVDDEHDVKLLFEQRFRKELKSSVYQFVFAFSGEEASAYLLDQGHDVVIILSDINMPGMSGLELLERIRKKYTKAPPKVIMISAYGDEANHQTAMQLGADDFLTKPINFELLKEKLLQENI